MGDPGVNGLLLWALQAVWGLFMALLMLWLKSGHDANVRQDQQITELLKPVYSSSESVENLKTSVDRIEKKLDNLIARQGPVPR